MQAIFEALAQYGPWAIVAGIFAWRSPDILRVILDHVRKRREATRKHEKNMQEFAIELEAKRQRLIGREREGGR